MANHRFADFELDEELRQLRLDGREVKLQPRAFDLLVYLVNHRFRVVDKEELLESIWPGVIVTDGSLQRAVSLARAALRAGGLDEAIRTYSGRGYRFTAVQGAREPASSATHSGFLEEARIRFREGSWSEATAAFGKADDVGALEPVDLESWGAALQCSGRARAAIEPYSRAAEAYAGLRRRRGWPGAAGRGGGIGAYRPGYAVARRHRVLWADIGLLQHRRLAAGRAMERELHALVPAPPCRPVLGLLPAASSGDIRRAGGTGTRAGRDQRQRRGPHHEWPRYHRRCPPLSGGHPSAAGRARTGRDRVPGRLRAWQHAPAGQSGDLETAEALVDELDDRPASWSAGTTRAQVLRAKGELHLIWGEPDEAVPLLRDAFRIFHDMDACLEAAVARLRLADALYRVPDPEGAALELDSAERLFERQGARLYLDDCRTLRSREAA